MGQYFDQGQPVYSWFNELSHVVEGMGVSFYDHSVAHLDLVQEATDPVWSELACSPKSVRSIIWAVWTIQMPMTMRKESASGH
jgi:hypothetical protein